MGKKRVRQLMNNTHFASGDVGQRDNAPSDFLTSDNFQVVKKKRNHSAKNLLDRLNDQLISSEKILEECEHRKELLEEAAINSQSTSDSKEQKVKVSRFRTEKWLLAQRNLLGDAADNDSLTNEGKENTEDKQGETIESITNHDNNSPLSHENGQESICQVGQGKDQLKIKDCATQKSADLKVQSSGLGIDDEDFWEKYCVHYRTTKPLEELKINQNTDGESCYVNGQICQGTDEQKFENCSQPLSASLENIPLGFDLDADVSGAKCSTTYDSKSSGLECNNKPMHPVDKLEDDYTSLSEEDLISEISDSHLQMCSELGMEQEISAEGREVLTDILSKLQEMKGGIAEIQTGSDMMKVINENLAKASGELQKAAQNVIKMPKSKQKRKRRNRAKLEQRDSSSSHSPNSSGKDEANVFKNCDMKNNGLDNSRECEGKCESIDEHKDNGRNECEDRDRNKCKERGNECKAKDRKRPNKKQITKIHEVLRKTREEQDLREKAEEMARKAAEEAERLKQEKARLEQEKKEKRKLREKEKKEKLRAEGRLLSKSQKQSQARLAATLEFMRQQGVKVPQIKERGTQGPISRTNRKRMDSLQSEPSSSSGRQKSESLSSQGSGVECSSDLPSSFESKDSWKGCASSVDDPHSRLGKSFVAKKNVANLKEAEGKRNISTTDSVKLRSPVVCVLGHVDTGKTKLLDYIRKTHVQDGEAGGITQQIGATMIPQEALKEKCKMVKDFSSIQLKVPGLLVIDTPGHESFSNLRSRGSSICDIAILVVDLMHGFEPQTIESINLLKRGKIPFLVALNKVDRLYGWKSSKDEDIETVIAKQDINTQMEFKKRYQEVILQFANQSLNAALYYQNRDPRSFVSMVPTSAITGDGMGNLLALITTLSQSRLKKKLVFSEELTASVLEVKVSPGLGTTIDVILVNGRLQEGDTIVLAGQDGPIVTQIRSLLMPHPLKELRVKSPYIEYKSVEAAQGVRISAKELEKALAGLPLLKAQAPNKVDALKAEISDLLQQSTSFIHTSERGVYVQASTLGSLEALLAYLASADIPYAGVKVGPVVKKDVVKASVMLEHDAQYAAILAFDVKVERDAQVLADNLGVKVFQANIIYHLSDEYVLYKEELLKSRQALMQQAVFPCILKILPQPVPKLVQDSIILSVLVEAGILKTGTPLCVPSKGNMDVGVVVSILLGDGVANSAKEGEEVQITIETKEGDLPAVYGEDFHLDDSLVSRLTRQSIDACKEYFRDELNQAEWHLMSELKKMFHIHN